MFASSQKNLGISGFAVIILKKDHRINKGKSLQQYEKRSLYKMLAIYAIFVADVFFKWMLDQGGLEAMDKSSM